MSAAARPGPSPGADPRPPRPSRSHAGVHLGLLGCLLIALLRADPAAAQFSPAPADFPVGELYRVELLAGLWAPAQDLTATSLVSGVSGTTLDATGNSGAAALRFKDVRLRVRPHRRHRVLLDYLPTRYPAGTTLDRGLVLQGIRFEPGVPLGSTFTWNTWRLAYEYDPIHRARGAAGLLVEARYTGLEIALDRAPGAACDAASSACEFTRRRRLVPAVGGVVRLYPSPVIGLGAEASLLRMPAGAGDLFGRPGQHLAYDVYAALNFLQSFGLQIGYRSLHLNLETTDHTADLKQEGVYVGALVRF